MGKLVSLIDENDFKKNFLRMLKEDSNFKEDVKVELGIVFQPVPSNIFIDETGIDLRSGRNQEWALKLNSCVDYKSPIRIDPFSNEIKMFAHRLNVDELFIKDKKIMGGPEEYWT